jgi:hypothetical protein
VNAGETFGDARDRYVYESMTLPETRVLPRPRLVSRPLPQSWVPDADGMLVHSSGFQAENSLAAELTDDELAGLISLGTGIVELATWARHERAVRAQP